MEFEKLKGKERLEKFAEEIIEIDQTVGIAMSARGWGYFLEGRKVVTKEQIDLIENLVNECRKEGKVPVDFVAQEEARRFSGVEIPTRESPITYTGKYLRAALRAEEIYTPNWWDGEEYYIQMVVEKIDLKSLFEPICEEYHIPIATSKGWSSVFQRAEYARRFKEAEAKGLRCVLSYYGDHDPDGLRISDFLRNNLEEIKNIRWKDGTEGYDPENLIIKRFGLDYDFIEANNLVWVDNLITGSGGCLAEVVNGKIVQGRTKAGKPHPNFLMDYVQEYLKKYGVRKCEANALMGRPDAGRELCRSAIEIWLGNNALGRFEKKRQNVRDILKEFKERTGLDKSVQSALDIVREEEKKEEGSDST